MPYCSKCGTEIAAGVNFCPTCGSPCGRTVEVHPAVIEEIETDAEKKLLAVFAFLSFFFIIYLAKFRRNDKFLIFYANQALVALIFFVGLLIIPFLGWGLEVAVIVFLIISLVGAANGRYRKMPLIGAIRILKHRP